ncbi:NAD-dependent epimerase/dehydratase family protein [Chloroflexota bacterium]
MKVLVLGGNGLFGRKTVINLVKDPEVETVVSMDVSPVKPWVMKSIEKNKDKFNYVRGDVSELENILNAIKTYDIDKIVNWAFLLPGVAESNPRPSVKVNALGMCNAFEAARLMGVPRVVYASSEGVYGPQNEYGDRDVVEDDHMHPSSGYAVMKMFAEILAQQYTDLYGINFSAVRPTIGYGHGGLTPAVIKQFSDICSLPATGEKFSVQSDGTNKFSLASADDVAEITRLLLHMDSSPHSAYNVGTKPTSLKEAAEVVKKYIPDARIEFGNEPPPPDSGESGIPWRISMDRAKEDLGFSMLPLEKAVLIHINDARMEAGLEPIKG